jgi:hypothetical protein
MKGIFTIDREVKYMLKYVLFSLIVLAGFFCFKDFTAKSVAVAAPVVTVFKNVTPFESRADKPSVESRDFSINDEVALNAYKSTLSLSIGVADSWLESKGYFFRTEISSEYNGYDDDTLHTLADNGDLRALTILADKKISSGDVDIARQYLSRAVVIGSTAAIIKLAIMAQPDQYDVRGLSDKQKVDASIEALSLYRFAALRGDTDAANRGFNSLVELRDLHIEESDARRISNRASEIFNDYRAQRLAIGYEDFDNTRFGYSK